MTASAGRASSAGPTTRSTVGSSAAPSSGSPDTGMLGRTDGAHSMIERPEPVRRVTPPSTIITMTMNATANSQVATSRRLRRPAARSSGGAPGKSRTSNGMSGYIGVGVGNGYHGRGVLSDGFRCAQPIHRAPLVMASRLRYVVELPRRRNVVRWVEQRNPSPGPPLQCSRRYAPGFRYEGGFIRRAEATRTECTLPSSSRCQKSRNLRSSGKRGARSVPARCRSARYPDSPADGNRFWPWSVDSPSFATQGSFWSPSVVLPVHPTTA